MAVTLKQAKATLHQKVALVMSGVMLCIYGINNALYADSVSSAPTSQLFDAAGNFAQKLIEGLDDFYCSKLFPLIFVFDLIMLAISKDERKIAVEKKALITICIVFVLIKGVTVIQTTLENVATF